jgi:hypothetical protein
MPADTKPKQRIREEEAGEQVADLLVPDDGTLSKDGDPEKRSSRADPRHRTSDGVVGAR